MVVNTTEKVLEDLLIPQPEIARKGQVAPNILELK